MTNIEGAVALVTGGQRGLGAAFVNALLRHGAAKVYATARKPVLNPDPRVVGEELDVTDAQSVRSLAERTGDVEILVNNAGVLIPGPLLKATEEEIRSTFDTNVFGALHVAQTFAPNLASNGGGALVNVHSVFSWAPGAGSYGASKAALWSLSNSLRLELAGQGTQVLGVHVGFVDTEMVEGFQVEKIRPDLVADKVMTALIAGQVEILVDEASRQAKEALSDPLNS